MTDVFLGVDSVVSRKFFRHLLEIQSQSHTAEKFKKHSSHHTHQKKRVENSLERLQNPHHSRNSHKQSVLSANHKKILKKLDHTLDRLEGKPVHEEPIKTQTHTHKTKQHPGYGTQIHELETELSHAEQKEAQTKSEVHHLRKKVQQLEEELQILVSELIHVQKVKQNSKKSLVNHKSSSHKSSLSAEQKKEIHQQIKTIEDKIHRAKDMDLEKKHILQKRVEILTQMLKQK
ncbi:MAG: hypothetical protein ACMXYA_01530 [Candidatus Woesearchaeota archaeon]